MAEMELDPGLLADFITESQELLEDYSSSLTAFENCPEDESIINPIFRAAHTLKGSSAFFGLTHIKNFAHKLENLLDDVRHKTRPLDRDVLEFLFLGGNHLKDMFERLNSGDLKTELTPEEDDFLARLTEFVGQNENEKPEGEPGAAFIQACLKIKNMLGDALEGGLEPEQIIQNVAELVNGLPWPEERGPAQTGPPRLPTLITYEELDLSEPLISLLNAFTQALGGGAFDAAGALSNLEALGAKLTGAGYGEQAGLLAAVTDDFKAVHDSGLDFDDVLLGLFKGKLDDFCRPLTMIYDDEPTPEAHPAPHEAAPDEKPETAGPAPEAKAVREEKRERKTMRIDEDKVDGFMNYVGELIVTAETFNYLQKMIEKEKVNPNTIRAFKNANQAFRELSDELQDGLMEIRRVPLKGIFQKINMMARELSHQLGKKVRVRLDGQDVQIDKSIAESLEGPMVHVVRNSLDHGLELVEERLAIGKPEEGLLKMTATADKEFFHLTVSDDGRGIDPVKMRAAAVNRGLLSEARAAELTDREALGLIFGAGFSTAAEITDVSGRGVGMDVVRSNIQALNGSINVDSQVGEGTTISLKIPLAVTLQVVKALHVRVGRENFIISLEDIVESLRPTVEELATVEGRGQVLNRRGQITPLIKLSDIFNIPGDFSDPTDGLLVLLETISGRYALLVDEVMGQQQVVVKELASQFKKLGFLSGSALLGDGGLGLVLDANGLVRLALER